MHEMLDNENTGNKMTTFEVSRNRKIYFVLIILTIILGLGSRIAIIPVFIYPYLGDYFYTIMYFFIIGFLFPNMKILKVTLISIGLCYVIEIFQLYQADWINNIRSTTLGRLTLGSGFLWSDLISYALGGMTGFLLETKYYLSKQIK